ncbi:DNA-3-methyladenine glycosylase family protein [Marinivivus vitaminiproducens]|uniref:DNA-3-methyladenine glycosylase family protein n=1 Tax=Marinivivus vitaminiproducens TaxID=3035935 RepID=UPI00279A53A7|nr:DNA-3-methyladenine glycosylase 2 family protein [Geminicoccaceae bacterium SCSIO 64248]
MRAGPSPVVLWNGREPDLELRPGLEALAARDPDVARAFAACGLPPVRRQEPGYAGLVRIISAQQISVLAAQAILARLRAELGTITPQSVLALPEERFKALGFSRAKIAYSRALAEDILSGRIDLNAIASLPDDEAVTALCRARGVGRWTAEIYLLFGLRRGDVWPADDLAVRVAAQKLKGWPARPTLAEMAVLGEAWRPHRSAGARLLWHIYRHPGLA